MAAIASIYAQLELDTRKTQKLVTREMGQAGEKAGREFSSEFAQHSTAGVTAAAKKTTAQTAAVYGKAGSSAGKRLGSGLSAGVKTAMKGIASAAAVYVGIDMFRSMIRDAQEAARVNRIVANTIRTTGSAANVTAPQISKMAEALMRQSGINDEVIKSGAAMLLTFRGIRNEAGKGNDIFTRANSILLDMTSAMHGGEVTSDTMRSTAIQLGKALNDPVRGMTALRRVGVTFTAQQETQIRTLLRQGNALGAQKIILRELGQEFGGTARAAADPMKQMQTQIGEIGESLGTLMLPALRTGAKLISQLVANPGAFKAVAAGVAAIAAAFVGAKIAVMLFGTGLKAALIGSGVGLIILGIGTAIMLIVTHLDTVKKIWHTVWSFCAKVIRTVWDWIKANWPLLLSILTGPVGAAVIWIVRHWQTVVDAFKTAWNKIKTTAQLVWDYIKLAALKAVDWVLRAFSRIPIIGGFFKSAEKTVSRWITAIQGDIDRLSGKTVQVYTKFAALTGAGGKIKNPGGAAGGRVRGPGTRTSDTAGLFALSRDEWVIRAAAAGKYGPAAMASVNAGTATIIPGMAAGGPVIAAKFHTQPSAKEIARQINAIVDAMATDWGKQFAAALARQAATAATAGYWGPTPKGPLQTYARQLLAARGWGGQWAAFNALVMGESGWNVYATNPSSGAYGIPQALPASKMASAGPDWRTSGYTQLRWMMAYLASVYGSPARAYAMWLARSPHWYREGGPVRSLAGGGIVREPVLGIGAWSGQGYTFAERGPEAVGSGSSLERRIDRLISSVDALPVKVAAGVAKAAAGPDHLRALNARLGAR